MEKDILENVAEVVRLYYRPVSTSEVARASRLSVSTTVNALHELVQLGKIEMVNDGSGAYFQYHSEEKSQEKADLEIRFAQLDNALNEKSAQLDKRIEQVEKETSHIYSSLISIMGVFVAIFSLVIINASAISGALSSDDNLGSAFLRLLTLNAPVVLSVVILLFGIKYIILRDFNRGVKK